MLAANALVWPSASVVRILLGTPRAELLHRHDSRRGHRPLLWQVRVNSAPAASLDSTAEVPQISDGIAASQRMRNECHFLP
jgi:hypothetical protein